MSFLRKIELEKDDVFITLKLTKKERELITPNMKEFIVLPTDSLNKILTTGKLGNGNRIMIPNGFLKSHDIDVLKKKVQSIIIDLGDKKFLLIELENKGVGRPVFNEDDGD